MGTLCTHTSWRAHTNCFLLFCTNLASEAFSEQLSEEEHFTHTHTLAHGESNVHTHIHSLTHLKFRYSIVHPNERVNMKCSLQCFYCYRRYSFALGQISFYNSALLFLFTTNICIRRIVHDELNIPKIKIAVKSTTTCVCV